MEETQIKKARMLGGKLGKRVSSLLPGSENENPTMGSIARLLSLNQLQKAIGEESGRWVFDACRGIDFEEVKATLRVLPKSITVREVFFCGVLSYFFDDDNDVIYTLRFKPFPNQSHSFVILLGIQIISKDILSGPRKVDGELS